MIPYEWSTPRRPGERGRSGSRAPDGPATEMGERGRFKRGAAMPRMSLLSSPLLLGFDEIERLVDRVAKGGADGYPPYNIERIPKDEASAETLRITLAVAGFTRD